MKVLIVDDEKHARTRLIKMLKEIDFFSDFIEADNADEALNIILKEDLTAAFLDINMPGLSVFEALKKLKNPPLIIFHTAYSEHAVKAFDVEALDYLLKPVSKDRLISCIEKIKEQINQKINSNKKFSFKPDEISQSKKNLYLQKITCKKAGIINLIDIEEIIKISSNGGVCFVITKDNNYMLEHYLNYYEENLNKELFFRANRNDLINLKFIKSIHSMFKGNYVIELINGDSITLSRRMKSSFKRIYRLT